MWPITLCREMHKEKGVVISLVDLNEKRAP